MVITFEEERQSPKKLYAAVAVFVIILGIAGYFGYSYFSAQEKSMSETPAKKVEVNWNTLKDKKLDRLDAFPEIGPAQGDVGKENPFE